jgi:DnaJ homolog subfamily A member 5
MSEVESISRKCRGETRRITSSLIANVSGRLKWEMRKENRELGLPDDEDGEEDGDGDGDEGVLDRAREEPPINDVDRRIVDMADKVEAVQLETDNDYGGDTHSQPQRKSKKKGRGRPATPVEDEPLTPLMGRKKGKRRGFNPNGETEVTRAEAEQGSVGVVSLEVGGDLDRSQGGSGTATPADAGNAPELTKREKRRAREAAKKALQDAPAQKGDEV